MDRTPGIRAVRSTWALLLASMTVSLCISGCSLVSLKSPERPLSTRDLNARILTRVYSYQFIAAVEQCADQISAAENDPDVVANTLRWKIVAAAESQRAATQIAPMMSVLDTWTLALQMKAFMSPGNAGAALFGRHQNTALAVVSELADDADALAKRLIPPGEFDRYRKFADAYTREHPLENLQFVRPSVVELWSRETRADVKLVDSLGTIPEAMADVASRLQMYSDTLPSRAMWRTQLALRESGYSRSDVRAALAQLDNRLAGLSAAADTAPDLVHGVVADVRRSVDLVLDRLDASSAALIKALDVERAALSTTVRTEREAVTGAVDAQRTAIALDAGRIADQVVRSAGEQVRHLAREVLLLLIVMFLMALGLPFAAGYLVGRARRDRIPAGGGGAPASRSEPTP
jgi:hypothetical protein